MVKNVSGRAWKSLQTSKSTSKVTKGNGAFIGWDKRQELRKKSDIVKGLESEILKEKKESKSAEKEERERRKHLKEQREKEAEITVKISDAKARRMKRKQLRALRKK